MKLTINEPSFVEVRWGTEHQGDQTQQKYGNLHVSCEKQNLMSNNSLVLRCASFKFLFSVFMTFGSLSTENTSYFLSLLKFLNLE